MTFPHGFVDFLKVTLDNHHISARPLSAPHRGMRWASREPKLAVLCALLVASLLAATLALLAR